MNSTKHLLILLICGLFISCEKKYEKYYPYPCSDGNCHDVFFVNVPFDSYLDKNGYWRVKYQGFKYFTVKGKLDVVHEEYIINEVPLVSTVFDSNYWIWIDNLSFTIPVYSVYSWFTDKEFNNPINVGNTTIYLTDIFNNSSPMNISGYQISDKTCWDCPYTDTLFGTYSKYTREPQHSFYMDERMIGDTLQVYVKVIYNTDLGWSVENEHVLDIIID